MPRRRKWIRRAIICVVALILVAVLTKEVFLPLFDNADDEQSHIVEPYGYNGTEDDLVLENDALRFEMDPDTTQFTVTDKRTGEVWYSSPPEADSDPIALPVEKNRMKSALTLTYSQSTGMQTMLTSHEYSVTNQVYEVGREGDAVVVHFSLGRISRAYIIPTAITEERMDAFTGGMTTKQKREVLDYYEKKSLGSLKAKDDPEALLASYPDLAENTLYILRDTVKDHIRLKLEGYFEEAGYTHDEYEYDLSRITATGGTATAVFNITVRYTLENNDLVVTVPLAEIDFNSTYPIVSLSLLPAFGAGGTADTGWMLVPDGNGGIIRFNNGKTDQNPYYGNLYGWDWASLRTQVISETNCPYPVFGISRNGASFLCLMEEGAPWAGVSADISGRYTSYNTVYASYTLQHGDPYDVSDRSNNANYLFEKELPEGSLRQRYRFLTTDTAGGMAEAYRDYLTGQLPAQGNQVKADVPLNIELLGAIDKVQQRAGIPTLLPVAMTSYRQASDMLETLLKDGFEGFSIRYTGWMNGGINQKMLNQVRLVGELGDESDLRRLTALARDSGVPVYLDGLTSFARNSGLTDGFIAVRDAAKLTTQETVELKQYSSIWYGTRTTSPSYYLLKPALMTRFAGVLREAAAEYRASGVSYRDVGSILSADYNRKDWVTRVQSEQLQLQILEDTRAAEKLVMTRKGYDYAILRSDLVIDMDFDGGNYGIIDYYAPFYPMAIHGLSSYTGVSLNLADDWETVLLQSAESGAGLSFTLSAESTRRLQSTDYSDYYGADVSLIYDRLREVWSRYSTEMAGLNDQRITGCAREGLLAVTTYENGVRVYVNYGYEPLEADGVTVPARDYLVRREEAQ